MNDLDPNHLLPLWRAVVAHFRRYPPLVQSHGRGKAAVPTTQPQRDTAPTKKSVYRQRVTLPRWYW